MVEELDRGLAVVPLRIRIGDREFVDDGRTDTYALFYEELRRGGTPITSTPAPGEYLDAFRRLDTGHIVCLTIPARWSGMFDAATLAADMLAADEGRQRVSVFETGTAIGGLALVARVVSERCAAGDPVDAVEEAVHAAVRDVRLFGTLSTLTYVARSGRVNSLIAGISNSLHVRPVFKLESGDTGRVALTRTTSGALEALQKVAVERLNSRAQRFLVFHADAAGEAAELAQRLTSGGDGVRAEVVELSPIGGAYTGPGAFGFAAIAPDGDSLH